MQFAREEFARMELLVIGQDTDVNHGVRQVLSRALTLVLEIVAE